MFRPNVRFVLYFSRGYERTGGENDKFPFRQLDLVSANYFNPVNDVKMARSDQIWTSKSQVQQTCKNRVFNTNRAFLTL